MRRMRLWLGVFALSFVALAACSKTAEKGASEEATKRSAADLENLDPRSLYDVVLEAPETLAAGESGTVTLAIRPKDGAEVKPETPLRASLESRGAIRAEKERLSYADHARVEGKGPVFEIPVRGEEAGQGELGVDLDFYVCIAELCMKTAEKLAVTAQVQ